MASIRDCRSIVLTTLSRIQFDVKKKLSGPADPEFSPSTWVLSYQDHPDLVFVLVRELRSWSGTSPSMDYNTVCKFLSERREICMSYLCSSDRTAEQVITVTFPPFHLESIVRNMSFLYDFESRSVSSILDRALPNRLQSLELFSANKQKTDINWLLSSGLYSGLSTFVYNIYNCIINIDNSVKYADPGWVKVKKTRAHLMVIYASPLSGKDEFKKNINNCYDADHMYDNVGYGVVLTTYPQLLQHGMYSIALLPDQKTYDDRVGASGRLDLMPYKELHAWLRYCNEVYLTNRKLSDVLSRKKVEDLVSGLANFNK